MFGRPLARMGDQTAHGGRLVGPPGGSKNVLINKRPAWRSIVDFSTCPVVGISPHIGGFTIPTNPTVLINKLPAAAVGNPILEVSPIPNMIVRGSPTVLMK